MTPEQTDRPTYQALFLPPQLQEGRLVPPARLPDRSPENTLPPPNPIPNQPQWYVPSPELCQAVDTAVYSGLPLLLTGEPGTGKSQVAYSIAYQFGLPLFRFDTKSTSIATDLLYEYDVVHRFYEAGLHGRHVQPTRDPNNPAEYIRFSPLGLALILASPEHTEWVARFRYAFEEKQRDVTGVYDLKDLTMSPRQTRSVVLIDEIDKAPRDLPNDLLNELDRMEFRIKELDMPPLRAADDCRPIVIMTSNQEKELPDPFLRRCAYFDVAFPDHEQLKQIIAARLGRSSDLAESAIALFEEIREQRLRKKPATAELLTWLLYMEKRGFSAQQIQNRDAAVLQSARTLLLKNQSDTSAI